MTQRTVTTIINNYNYARYLDDAIGSVLREMPAISQLIVVDDGSTDNSRAIIECYAGRLTPLYLSNRGQALACIAALDLVKTDYVHFLDADDMLMEGFGQRVRDALAERPAKVQVRLQSIDDNGNALTVFPKLSAGYDRKAAFNDMLHLGMPNSPPTSGNIFRMDVLDEIRCDPPEYERAIDGLPVFLAPIKGEIVSITDEPLVFYRVHGGNMHQQHELHGARLRNEIVRMENRWAHMERLLGQRHCQNPAGSAFALEWKISADVADDLPVRLGDVVGYASQIWRSSLDSTEKLKFTTWIAAVFLSRGETRRTVCAWRLSPLNRPKLFSRFRLFR